jgi:hypothetical protein
MEEARLRGDVFGESFPVTAQATIAISMASLPHHNFNVGRDREGLWCRDGRVGLRCERIEKEGSGRMGGGAAPGLAS